MGVEVGRTLDTDRQLSAHGQDRRADIVRHAERLFAERGYAGTRMTDVAAAAGITKGLVYWYFENKEALVAEIIVDMRERLRAVQQEALREVDDLLGMAYATTVATVEFILEHAALFGLTSTVSNDRRWREASDESWEIHAADASALMAIGQQAGVYRNDEPPQLLAAANTGVIDHICLMTHAGRLRVDPATAAAFAARTVVRTIAADQAGAERVIAARQRPVRRAPARRRPTAHRPAS